VRRHSRRGRQRPCSRHWRPRKSAAQTRAEDHEATVKGDPSDGLEMVDVPPSELERAEESSGYVNGGLFDGD
jgi:hypothetical protein